jgi:hypothetical protein
MQEDLFVEGGETDVKYLFILEEIYQIIMILIVMES